MRHYTIGAALLLLAALAYAETPAEALLHRAEAAVDAARVRFKKISGEFVQHEQVDYTFPTRTGISRFTYRVVLKDGIEVKRIDMGSDTSDEARMMRQLSAAKKIDLNVDEHVFPFHRSFRDAKTKELKVWQESDAKMGGRLSFVLGFQYTADSDSGRTTGNGKIWLAKDSYLPVRAEYLLEGRLQASFKFKIFLDFIEQNGLPLILRNENQSDFTRSGMNLATMKNVAVRSDYSLH